MDADAFEELSYPSLASHNQVTLDDTQGTLKDTTQQTGPTDTADLETASEVVIDKFPFGSPGAPIPGMLRGSSAYEMLQKMRADTPWAPFSSQLDWEVAQWAKMHGQTSTAVAELLALPGVHDFYPLNTMHLIQTRKVVGGLGLSFHTVKGLNEMINDKLPGCPPFQCKDVTFDEECLEFYYRDVMKCIRGIYSDPGFKSELVFTPERHYTSHECTCCVYNEMYTGDWWWKVQVSEP